MAFAEIGANALAAFIAGVRFVRWTVSDLSPIFCVIA